MNRSKTFDKRDPIKEAGKISNGVYLNTKSPNLNYHNSKWAEVSNLRNPCYYNNKNNRKTKAQKIIQKCIQQSRQFTKWSQYRNWELFHRSHYDWWAFPIDIGSAAHGDDYKIQKHQFTLFTNSQPFINALRDNAILVCRSWGWDLLECKEIEKKCAQQRWQKWPVRLYKMCMSLQIFREISDIQFLYRSALKYAKNLCGEYENMNFGRNDIRAFFLKKNQQLEAVQQKEKKNFHKEKEQEIIKNIQIRQQAQIKQVKREYSQNQQNKQVKYPLR